MGTFYKNINQFKFLNILGLTKMQSGVFTEDDKPNIKKFYTLRKLSLHINPTILLNL